MTRLVTLVFAVLAACSSRGFSSSDRVPELTTSQQEELCKDFLDDICSGPLSQFCDDPCIRTGCGPAALSGEIDVECTDISVGMVDDCAASGTAGVCGAGGGCMFDALEAVCP